MPSVGYANASIIYNAHTRHCAGKTRARRVVLRVYASHTRSGGFARSNVHFSRQTAASTVKIVRGSARRYYVTCRSIMIPPSHDKNKVSVIQTHSHIRAYAHEGTLGLACISGEGKDNGKHRALTKLRAENYSSCLIAPSRLPRGDIIILYISRGVSA